MSRQRSILRFLAVAGIWMLVTGFVMPNSTPFFISRTHTHGQAMEDTVAKRKPRMSVRRTTTETTDDVRHRSSDLKDPDNLKTEVTYDEKNGTYNVGTTMADAKDLTNDRKKDRKTQDANTNQGKGKADGTRQSNVKMGSFLPANQNGMTLGTATGYLTPPLEMTAKEYLDWSLRKSMAQYYRQRNQEQYETSGKNKFDFTDLHFSLGPAEKIFGPGGVRIKTQGSAELKMGANMKSTDNPSLAANRRSTFGFDFDMKINLHVNGKIGDKVNMNLNYNSGATFDYDAQNLKLKYEGKEDEIIKLVEAGNVSMPSNMSLVPGVSSLFGVRTDLQFGKLKMQAVVSQKKSASKSAGSKGGSNTNSYEFDATEYEENKHFYLAQFFREAYDRNMRTLPTVASGIEIKRIEVWVTNKTGSINNTRNIIALTDLGESQQKYIYGPWTAKGSSVPSNSGNDEYSTLAAETDLRDISKVSQILEGKYNLKGSFDYEKLQNARLLSANEYHLNKDLGTLTLNSALQPDEILAVAIEFSYGATTYQIGEFASNVTNSSQTLMVKMLKGSANSPSIPTWRLMMRNVYSLGASTTQKEKFKLDIKYQSDSSGVYLTYLPEDTLKNTTLLRALGLDRLDANNKPNPNNQFDYVEGYTIYKGRIFFPVAEPFGEYLHKWIEERGGKEMADKYAFPELYTNTRTIAKQKAEKNKYILTGEYRGSSANEIDLGVTNIAPGSVVVTAGGVTLKENTDYTVDYAMGRVVIINQSIIDSGAAVNASVESNDTYGMQRKTFLGFNLDYEFSKNLTVGGTVQYLSETPMTTKIAMGNEALRNILWGAHISWKHRAQWLTDWINKIPFINVTKPSQITFDAQVAQLIAGQSSNAQGGASYLDDFEDTKKKTSLIQPTYWQLASTPSQYWESRLSNDERYGYNRALMAWYCIDPIFTNRNSTLTPSHIKTDTKQLSNHYVRPIYELELYPNKSQTSYTSNSTLNVMNVAFYPKERGPYNLTRDVDDHGYLNLPKTRWGGMMRKMENTDFEAQNIEYIEFWLMDPFHYQRKEGTGTELGGNLYFDLGEVSEDILKDGKKFYESGMPISPEESYLEKTTWGLIPTTNSVTYAFNNESGSRAKQDVGLNGLNDEQEREFGIYQDFWNDVFSGSLSTKLDPETRDSLLVDPANDNYHYFRGEDYDRQKKSILSRYKRINMPQGNSKESEGQRYESAWKSTPDIEDINTDYTLNEHEKFWHYQMPVTPAYLSKENPGRYVSDIRTATVTLRDGTVDNIDWYLIRIPLQDTDRESIGGITDFSSIRFMRMYLDNFQDSVILRFGTLDLVHGDWRTYENALYQVGSTVSSATNFTVTSVNIEENNDRKPVNYVVPPGISRITDTSGSQLVESNEQALAMTATYLGSNDARAVYKNCRYDMRKYKHLQLFVHANALSQDNQEYTPLQSGQVSVFLRLGSDYRNNFYEYEVPLELTPEWTVTKYNNNSPEDRLKVWPAGNMLDFDLALLTSLKKQRNKSGIAYSQLFVGYDPDRPNNRISIKGNPSLGEVKTIMIGIRNHAETDKSAEVWVNELRLQEFTNEGGWAAQGNLNIQLSDIGSFTATGKVVTAGFGGIEQSVMDRKDENDYQYQFTTNVDLGRLLPEKAKVTVPFYYSYSKQISKPKYNPLDTDMLLEDAMEALNTQEERDSLASLTTSVTESRNMSISGAKINIASKKHPMPYDPANFSFSYSRSRTTRRGRTTLYEYDTSWKAQLNYTWSPNWKNWEPFKKWKTKNKWATIIKEQNIAFAPQNITFGTDLSHAYYELQERDLDNLENPQSLPVQFSSTYLWNRNFSLRWDLFKSLHFTFKSATHAEVEQPNVVINKDLYPEQYEAWKDSVKVSLAHFGRPLDYNQSVSMSYKLPINKIPCFDWITADGTYNSSYSWKRGSELEDGTSLGNTVNTQRTVNANGKLAMETLYNHWDFLKEANKRFSSSNTRNASNKKVEQKKKEQEARKKQKEQELKEREALLVKARDEAKKTNVSVDSIMARELAAMKKTQTNLKGVSAQKKTTKQTKGFAQEIRLLPDTTITIAHNQKSKRLIVRMQDSKGHDVKVKYQKLDDNKIKLITSSADSNRVRLNVMAKPKASEQKWYKWAQAGARFMMMLRSASVSYKNTYNLSLPGFKPEVGDILGQRMTNQGFTPGVGFAFGFVDDSYIEEARGKGWLMNDSTLSSPAISSKSEDLQIKATLEPITDLKIDINMSRTQNQSRSIQYMYEGNPTTRTGSFNMTTISIGTAFASHGTASNGYRSAPFEKFRELLGIYQQRVEAQYIGMKDPQNKTYVGSGGTKTDATNNNPANIYGADVMVPAFLAAYCGGGTTRELKIFPSLLQMLPNWNLTYKGLSTLPWIRDHFKSVQITHGYKSIYSVGSYNSFASWLQVMDGSELGFISNTTGDMYSPGSCYDVSTVSINESFCPLAGLNLTFMNNMTLKTEYRTTRVLALSMTNAQITETVSNDFVLGWGYKLNDFRLSSIFGFSKASKKAAMRTTARNRAQKGNTNSNDNDLNIRKNRNAFAHTLNLRFDLSIRNQAAIRRDIQTGLSEATSGNKAVKASFQLDYAMSKYVTLTMFYDRQSTSPLLSSSSYPTVTQDFGFTMKFNLTR